MLTAILVIVGIVAVYSASFAQAFAEYQSVAYFMVRQALFAAVGAVVMVLLMRLNYRLLKSWSWLLMLVALGGLVMVLVPGLGHAANGARRWIQLGSLPPLQPSEFAKLALLVYLAAWLSSRGKSLKEWGALFLPFVLMVGIFGGLVMVEPDMGTTLIIVIATLAVFFMAGAAWLHLAAMVAIGGVMSPFLVAIEGYRATRFLSFLRPEQDMAGVNFHITQLLIALGSGGLNGLGLGASRQKFFYVPGAHTDGVFAIIGEETGFIGGLAVIFLFAVLVYRGFHIAFAARDDFGRLLAAGITTWLAAQALINLGGITRSIPLTGIPMPFLSYGGSALISTMAAIGILLSISRYSKRDEGQEQGPVGRGAWQGTRRG